MEQLKEDLESQFNVKVDIFELDFSSHVNVSNFISKNVSILNKFDGALFPIGMMDDEDTIKNVDEKLNKLLSANFISIAYFANELSKIFEQKNKGVIVGFGSIAAAFGRQINTGYSSAKRALESFFESLIVSNLNSNTKVQFYLLGYLDTRLTADKKLLLPKGSTKKLAKIVHKNLNQNGVKKFFPSWWMIINFVIKNVPFFIMKKVIKNF